MASHSDYLAEPKPCPDSGIPSSSSTVKVHVIDTTSDIYLPDQGLMFKPQIALDNSVHCPSYSFLVSNGERHILFDLGVQPDHVTPPMQKRIHKMGFRASAKKHVAQILDEHASSIGVHSKDIEAVVWSHHHFDHTGNMNTFPPSTALIVGSGFKEAMTPAYPTNKESAFFESDYEGRDFREISVDKQLSIGGCSASDYFGDGSFYILDTPGHTAGHVCGLARVSSSPDTFVLMGGDACHNAGEMRPSEYLPLPKNIQPSPLKKYAGQGCPGELLQSLQPNKKANEPFYEPATGFNTDHDKAVESIGGLMKLDASERVLVILAHDVALYDQLPFFPESINNWHARGLDASTRWKFTEDFESVIESGSGDPKGASL